MKPETGQGEAVNVNEIRRSAFQEAAQFVANLDLGPWRRYGDLQDRIAAGIQAMGYDCALPPQEPQPVGPSELKLALSALLMSALNGSDPDLRMDGYIRWGLVEKRMHALVDAAPTPERGGVPLEPTDAMLDAGVEAAQRQDGEDDASAAVRTIYRAMIAALPQNLEASRSEDSTPQEPQPVGQENAGHIGDFTNDYADRFGVDRFMVAMLAKLAKKRAEGRGGWNDPIQCEVEDLQRMLKDHVKKGDPVDIANFCMMIWNREHPTAAPTPERGGAE